MSQPAPNTIITTANSYNQWQLMRCHITLTSSDHILRSCSISIPGDTGRTQSPSHQKMNSQLTHLTCEWYEKVLFKTFSRWLAFYCHLSRPVSPGSACFQINRIKRITLIFCPFCPNKSLIWCASLSLLYPLSFSNLPWPMTIKKLLLPGFILISEFLVSLLLFPIQYIIFTDEI